MKMLLNPKSERTKRTDERNVIHSNCPEQMVFHDLLSLVRSRNIL